LAIIVTRRRTNCQAASASAWLSPGRWPTDPPVILADEPTGSLDSVSTAQVFGILRDLVALRGKTVVAVTHDLNLASQMHRQIHIVDGHLQRDDRVTPAFHP
jgi:ABC-type lipoprotein export system ATPase subunit